MAKDSNWGGKREGSGRPTNGEVINIRKILDDNIDVNMVIQKLMERIESGDQRAIELFMKYRAGMPKQEIDLNVDGQVDLNVTLKGLISFDE
jgi:hypothetical protein|tara:strand:+ start:319 stop:594 length:276 start_codon:yes stop_codon:yes gene_type:complete